MNKILTITVDWDPLCMLLGIPNGLITDKYKGKLYKMLTFCARKCILLNWADKV